MIHVWFFHFWFLMFHFSVRNKNLICHLLRDFVPFYNRKNGSTIVYHAFGSFFSFLMKKQHGLYAIFLSSWNRRNGLHGKKYVHVFLVIYYITVFLNFWKSLRKIILFFFSGNNHYVKGFFWVKNDDFNMVKTRFYWKYAVLLPWPLRCVFWVKK